jgi:hypothetical protein
MDEAFAIPRTHDGDLASETNTQIHDMHELHKQVHVCTSRIAEFLTLHFYEDARAHIGRHSSPRGSPISVFDRRRRRDSRKGNDSLTASIFVKAHYKPDRFCALQLRAQSTCLWI